MNSAATSTFDSVEKIWRGPIIPQKYASSTSIGKAVLEVLLENPQRIAQICHHNDRQYTNREITTLSLKFAKHFKKLGLEQCDIIGFCGSNTDYLAPLYFGAMLMGLTFSTLDHSFDKVGIAHIFGISKPKIMFCDGGIYGRVKAAFEEHNLTKKIYTMKDHIEGVPSIMEFLEENDDGEFITEPLKLGGRQTAAILCSSGTTGLPKGVCMSHEALLNGLTVPLYPNERFLCFSTLHWISGLATLIYCTLFGATRVITDKGFSPENFFDMVEKYKVTSILSPPAQMALIVASPKIKAAALNSLENYYCGGSAVSYAVIKHLKSYLPQTRFYTGYGSSETPGLVTLGESSPEMGNIGVVIGNIELKVIDNNSHALGPNQMGEFCVKTPFPWAGYQGNESATAETRDETGWLHTGDLGYVDANGVAFIVDRKKDILKYNNFHYSPAEIEEVVLEVDEVSEVCVCGLPDLIYTHLPAALVVRKIGSTLSEQTIYDHVAKRTTHYKHLRGGIYFVESLPQTVTGKVIRKEATKLCEKLRNLNEKDLSGNFQIPKQTMK